MEKVYPPSKYMCSERLDLKKHFQEFREKHPIEAQETLNDESLETLIFNNLSVSDKNLQNATLENMNVKDLEAQKSAAFQGNCDKRSRFKCIAALAKFNAKFPKKELLHPVPPKTVDKPTVIDLELEKHYVMKIRVYHPFEYIPFGKNVKTYAVQKMKFSHEITVLDTNTLAEFRDKILCHNDRGMCVEYEHFTEAIAATNPKEVYPSGFLFINGVFYNDTRKEDYIDYSQVIREWAQKLDVGSFETADMQNTKIEDLKPRFGYPYVYQHQGKCEHIIVFSDAWLLNSKDSLNSSEYPCYSDVQRFYTKTCSICYASQATWVVTKADRLPHRNSFLCGQCFKSYNLIDGKKVGTFKAYPFYDRGRIC